MRRAILATNHADTVKKWTRCLGCGEAMWTDRCHRICRKCQRRNGSTPTARVYHTVLPRGARVAEAPEARALLDW